MPAISPMRPARGRACGLPSCPPPPPAEAQPILNATVRPTMKITEIKTFLMQAGSPSDSAWASDGKGHQTGSRNWLFLKVYTDEGVYGVGECSGWPRVIETAVRDLATVLIGEDPADIERLWQKMMVAQ